ncbi:gluconate 2-dehydrogenase subunit 3 family protein [Andreprevotia chitinilytica]|uniref:gluconate 2-dehydrogenase subunit 3 family protein n=1 Tax=Andreprevotia chitinilytica TaxID=396808 RepID=UPI000552AB20|nr:gluconate 2-dehydrogenase subunit 3 family protein [Andreprevotia chitinilytica]
MDHSSDEPSRRRFLKASLSVVPLVALGACGRPPEQGQASVISGSAGATSSNTASKYIPQFFTDPEWRFINAACDRLIPADDVGPGAVESGVPEFIDRQMLAAFGLAANWYMQGPYLPASPLFGYQGKQPPREVYRAGIAATDDYCKKQFGGKIFTELNHSQQEQVLTGLEKGQIQFDATSATDFFAFLLQNTKEGYLADPIHGGNKNMGSWKMIGFPGARADFIDWVSRHGEQYPLGPVSISGQAG